MISVEENALLTRVGPDTPMGELLRRYWHPIGGAAELTGKKFTKMVRLLGEDLVLYKDRSGTYGLIEPLCAHRRINLLYGVPLQHGLRCPYHGWAYDETGACIEQPYEGEVDPEAQFKDKIKLQAYPVQELGGLLWAYPGPPPVPLLPRWEPLIRPNSLRDIGVSVIPCNWLQIMENSLDPVHVEWLHQDFANYVQEQLDRPQDRAVMAHKRIGFDPFTHGIIKRRTRGDEGEDSPDWQRGHPILFPNTLVVGPQDALNFQFRVPVDDTNTLHIFYTVYTPGVAPLQQDAVPVFNIPLPLPNEQGQPPWELMDNAPGQDIFAWVTQGAIADRTKERLGRSDEGIILYRKMLRDNMRKMQLGEEPMNVFRDPAQAECIAIITERDKTSRFGGPAAKYSPITPQVEALFAQGGTREAGAGEPAERPTTARGFQGDLGLVVVSCARGDVRQSPNGLWVYDDDGQREVPVEGIHDERMAELDEMYQALTTGRPVRHDGRWGTATLEVVLAIMQSAREHREIMLSHQCDAY